MAPPTMVPADRTSACAPQNWPYRSLGNKIISRGAAADWVTAENGAQANTLHSITQKRTCGAGVSATSQIRLLNPVTAAQSDAYRTMRTGCQRSTRLPANSRQHATTIRVAALMLPIWFRLRPSD